MKLREHLEFLKEEGCELIIRYGVRIEANPNERTMGIQPIRVVEYEGVLINIINSSRGEVLCLMNPKNLYEVFTVLLKHVSNIDIKNKNEELIFKLKYNL